MVNGYRTTCFVDGCDHVPAARGYCRGHYTQLYRHGRITGLLRPHRSTHTPSGRVSEAATAAQPAEQEQYGEDHDDDDDDGDYEDSRSGNGDALTWGNLPIAGGAETAAGR